MKKLLCIGDNNLPIKHYYSVLKKVEIEGDIDAVKFVIDFSDRLFNQIERFNMSKGQLFRRQSYIKSWINQEINILNDFEINEDGGNGMDWVLSGVLTRYYNLIFNKYNIAYNDVYLSYFSEDTAKVLESVGA